MCVCVCVCVCWLVGEGAKKRPTMAQKGISTKRIYADTLHAFFRAYSDIVECNNITTVMTHFTVVLHACLS
jgi:hypothetical protein